MVIPQNLAIEFPPWIPSRRYSAGFAKYMSIMGHGKSAIYMKFFEHERRRIFVPTLTEATLISEEDHEKELPIIIFSHGLSSCRTVSRFGNLVLQNIIGCNEKERVSA